MTKVKKILEKLFGGLKMSWFTVIIFAVIAGIYTGLINQVPFLENTSFRDIAISPDCWVLFAVIIASNCKKSWESALKIFVFFMISQPLVYAVELPTLDFNLALGYYMNWLIPILLTLPGGFVAFYVKKNNVLGAIILSVATSLLIFLCFYYIINVHIISAVLCLLQIIAYLIVFTKKINLKIITISLTVVALVGGIIYSFTLKASTTKDLPEGNWKCVTELNSLSEVEITGNEIVYSCNQYIHEDELTFEDENGKTVVYKVVNINNLNGIWLEDVIEEQ